ncbi:sensor histidine kinase [Bacillus alkalicellulosilyticus]|uniref:sensor histidine kinase n=1 Tax=Alkalihalobacterium alkalicellulosilyticum TaxID=1912214 RepID=UPI0014836351|nr:ATP-binding protein [Bacillus alkalicellulosilyticus]
MNIKLFLDQLSFKNKIFLSFLVIVLILTGVSLLFVTSIRHVDNLNKDINQQDIPQLLLVHELQREAFSKRYILEGIMTYGFDSVTDFFYYNNSIETGNQPVSDELHSIRASLMEIDFIYLNKVQGLLRFDNFAMAEMVIEEELLPKMIKIEEDLFKLEQTISYSIANEANKISTVLHQSLFILFVTTTIAVTIAISLSLKISSEITKPIDQLINKVVLIAKGNYGLKVGKIEQFEFENLTTSINYMSDSLKHSFTRLSQEKLVREQILSSLPVGIISVDEEKNEIDINHTAAQLLGIPKERLKKELTSENKLSHNEFWEWYYSKELFETRKTKLTNEKQPITVLVSQSALYNNNNKIIGRLFHFIDISMIEKLQETVHRTEKLAIVGELAAGAAHEIRNPLAVIQGFLTIMNGSVPHQDQEKYQLPLLLKELERINLIIEDMLMLSKPGSPRKKSYVFVEVLNDIMPIIKTSCPPDIDIEIKMDPFVSNIDFDQMKQVFYNLIRNSIQAIGSNGVISIYSKLEGNQAAIYIRDTGCGIPEDIQHQVFEPFISNKDDGTGLGLTIIQRIIENHQGTIQLLSTSEEGTTFKILLPIEK